MDHPSRPSQLLRSPTPTPTPTPTRALRLALSALAALALLGSLPAHAVGRLADVDVIDRDSGATLPVYRHQGEYWVAGRPGARYAVAVRNATQGRVLGVMSVDGINVVSGETASWDQTGYVFSPWQRYEINGWRKSDAEVAAFHFTASQASYAARTGRPGNVGVIGVAVFREKAPPPAPELPYPPPRPLPGPELRGQEAPAGAAPSAPAAQESAAAGAARSREEATAMRDAARPAPLPAPRLGTGHGARESSWVGHTQFERRSPRPDEIIRIRYDSYENLIALGVIPRAETPPRPDPFPEAPPPRYVPDPPSWR